MFPGSRAGNGSELRINSVLHVNSALPPGAVLPIGWIAAGRPAQLFSPDRHDELWAVQEPLDFPGTVYGVARGAPPPSECGNRPLGTAPTSATGNSQTTPQNRLTKRRRRRLPRIRSCRDPRFRLSQITWRTSVAHHPTEDTPGAKTRLMCDGLAESV